MAGLSAELTGCPSQGTSFSDHRLVLDKNSIEISQKIDETYSQMLEKKTS